MSDWQERITRESPPAIRAEHDLRYALAAPLIAEGATWCDLGCGNGIAAAAALAGRRPSRGLLLVDLDAEAVSAAAREFADSECATLTADLGSADDLARVREHLATDGDTVVTCFEVIEHLETFQPLLTLLIELAQRQEATVLLSVPNDAFWSIENPFHKAVWGPGAMEELRRLLPDGHVILKQRALQGSAILAEDAGRETFELTAEIEPGGAPTHFLVAMGPAAGRVAPRACAVPTDLDGQRSWERQREAHLAYAEQVLARQSTWFAEWRAYINELERRLKMPLSGAAEDESPPAQS